jgi:hypothetical protein
LAVMPLVAEAVELVQDLVEYHPYRHLNQVFLNPHKALVFCLMQLALVKRPQPLTLK